MRVLLGDDPQIKFVLHSSEAGEALYRSLGFVEASRYFIRDRSSSTRGPGGPA
jgi:hypothetical protein